MGSQSQLTLTFSLFLVFLCNIFVSSGCIALIFRYVMPLNTWNRSEASIVTSMLIRGSQRPTSMLNFFSVVCLSVLFLVGLSVLACVCVCFSGLLEFVGCKTMFGLPNASDRVLI